MCDVPAETAPASSLPRSRPLDREAPRRIGAWQIAPRPDQRIRLARTRDPLAIPGALYRGPGELLLLADDAEIAAAAQLHDMSAAFCCIDLTGPDPLAAIGLGNLEPLAPGDSLTTRLADIRVTLCGTSDGLLLITENHSADWLWNWLLERLQVAAV